jgi:hypothetical protein
MWPFTKKQAARPAPQRKTICYRGGIVSFLLPAHWREEYEPEGGGMFYDERAGSGTLRLDVVSFSSQRAEEPEAMCKSVSGPQADTLGPGIFLKRYVAEAVEKGQPLHIHRWEVAVPVPPDSARLVIFSHTVLAGQESDPAIAAELSFVDEAVRAAAYSNARGVSGEQQGVR